MELLLKYEVSQLAGQTRGKIRWSRFRKLSWSWHFSCLFKLCRGIDPEKANEIISWHIRRWSRLYEVTGEFYQLKLVFKTTVCVLSLNLSYSSLQSQAFACNI